MDDGVRVVFEGPEGRSVVTIDLGAGTLTGANGGRLLPRRDAERVRAALDVLIPRGDLYERTSQAIEGEVRFEIVRDGRVVVQTWAGDGRPLDAPMRDVVEVARR
ncbi:MAG: hypothetical protein KC656_29100 [Myxococcales bacterium]|nr:hypothetical protein [Myxococcales bacterium]MCB9669404.1 hypothetical protein [Alphaproteobacteria bacterium]MCB9690331.1 hypothetical protein [Alphaproteobacteria bacterium]